ncbi:MAG TPA: response regulator [Thermodesulfovibrionia bacterium]|nr:response regulator [Thermodesulfovibrionia bacterium]
MKLLKAMLNRIGLDKLRLQTRVFLLYYLVVILSVSAVGYYGYTNAGNAIRNQAAEDVTDVTNEAAQDIDNFLKTIPLDLRYISHLPALKNYNYWNDLGVENKTGYWRFRVMANLLSFLSSKDSYYIIQILDTQGSEIVKIRYDRETGDAILEQVEALQDKHTEPYFYETMKLKKNEFYVSEITANAKGSQTRSSVTVIYFATPIIGDNEVRYGVAVVNVYAESLLSIIQHTESQSGITYHLVSPTGTCFYHQYKWKAEGKPESQEPNFQVIFPSIYTEVNDKAAGIVSDRGQVFSFKRIYPDSEDKNRYWILIGQIDEDKAMEKLNHFIYVFCAVFAAVLGLAFLGSRYTVNEFTEPLQRVTSQLDRLAKGEIVKEPVSYKAEDEILQIIKSACTLAESMEALTRQADVIASGDYGQTVVVLSENDKLGKAINNMTERLYQVEQENRRQNWLKDGLNQLSQRLSGDMGLHELAELSVSFVARYVEAGHGVFYVYKGEQQKPLELIGTYMFTERDTLSACYSLGEGAVGQAALEKKPILLKNIAREQVCITTGIVSAVPLNTFTYPILYDNTLYGVMELASFTPFDSVVQNFLIESGLIIAAYLYSVLQKEKIRKLLEIAEAAKRQAEEQSRKLQQANTEMEEQQQQLQQQTEELQQANMQMEEQQQQLQQQTEELRVTNAEIELQRQQVQQQADELQRKNQELVKAQDELTRKASQLELTNKYKSEFLANMSHELRTPLNSIIVLSRMMEKNEMSTMGPDDVKKANVIYQAGQELLRLINDILDLTKVEAGKMEVQVDQIVTEGLISEMQDLFGQTAREKGLAFVAEDRLKSAFRTDRNKLAQVLRNLLSNAFKYTKHGTVSLVIQRSEDAALPVEISVSDTGIGIPKEKHGLIFEAFQQVNGSISREYGGTGLGLSITKRFVELLGGRVELKSEPGQGSAFTILLPETYKGKYAVSEIMIEKKSDAPQSPRPMISEVKAPFEPVHDDRDTVTPSDTTILVIDDDPNFCKVIADVNKGHRYKTLIALTAQDGLDLLRRYPVSGILLDLTLPDMDGAEALRIIKSTRELSHIPVYIVSARDREPGLKGIEGYLQKPVTLEQIEKAEETILTASGRAVKTIVVLEGRTLKKQMIAELLKGQGISVLAAQNPKEITAHPDLVIVDYEQTHGSGFDTCQALCALMPHVPLIVYSSVNIDSEEEARLRQFTDSIIVQTDYAPQRLSKGINRFLQGISTKQDGSAKASLTRPVKGSEMLKGCRILVVDDDARNLFVITSALEQNGAKVMQAVSAKKIQEKLKAEAADLIFMDIMLPEMSGYEAIKMIRADETLKAIPIVALTAKALKGDKEKCLAAGANDYLSKPVDYELLVNTAVYWSSRNQL